MRNFYNRHILNHSSFILFVCALLFGNAVGHAQVIKEFSPRTSTHSPNREIYTLKGDFTLIGNTNLSIDPDPDATIDNDRNNGTSYPTYYVDVDSDPSTWNSSRAELVLYEDEDVDPACSDIVFAGLYWTGRAHDGQSPVEFTVPESDNARNNGNTFNGYTLSITSTSSIPSGSPIPGSGISNQRLATYTFTPQGGGEMVILRYYTWRTGNFGSDYQAAITVQVGSGSPVNIPVGTRTNNSTNNLTFTLATPYEINTGSQAITIKSLRKRQTSNSVNNNFSASVTSGGKTFHKRKVKIKGPGASGYTEITADQADIYYPETAHGQMYSGFAEVTDYVRAHGTGDYTVADIALRRSEERRGGREWSGGRVALAYG